MDMVKDYLMMEDYDVSDDTSNDKFHGQGLRWLTPECIGVDEITCETSILVVTERTAIKASKILCSFVSSMSCEKSAGTYIISFLTRSSLMPQNSLHCCLDSPEGRLTMIYCVAHDNPLYLWGSMRERKYLYLHYT